MHTIKYRMTGENLRPRRTKLEIPGWAGQPEPRVDGSRDTPGIAFPSRRRRNMASKSLSRTPNELRVTTTNGRLVFDGDFGPPPDEQRNWPPFRAFGEQFYTYQFCST